MTAHLAAADKAQGHAIAHLHNALTGWHPREELLAAERDLHDVHEHLTAAQAADRDVHVSWLLTPGIEDWVASVLAYSAGADSENLANAALSALHEFAVQGVVPRPWVRPTSAAEAAS